jgi:8-oxo-dGTP pyrophosphatase MutT (NUDIX family)
VDYIRYLRSMVGTKPVIMVTADVGIFNSEGELLLQRRARDKTWGLIGGFMELDETVEATARREVLEETGLRVGQLELLGVFSSAELLTFSNGDKIQLVTVGYVSDEANGTPQLSEEGLELRYFALDALPEPLFAPNIPILEAVRARFGKR